MSLFDHDNSLTDKNSTHCYLETYEKLFNAKKNAEVNVLEIGIHHGGSIKMWNEYFTNGKIYGIDVCTLNSIKDSSIKNNEKVTLLVQKNAYDQNFINSYLSHIKFDALIDDGPHTLESMIFFVENYSQLMKDDGVLIIEDIQQYDWIDKLREKTPEDLKKYIHVVDLRNVKNRYDDILFIIDRSGTLS